MITKSVNFRTRGPGTCIFYLCVIGRSVLAQLAALTVSFSLSANPVISGRKSWWCFAHQRFSTCHSILRCNTSGETNMYVVKQIQRSDIKLCRSRAVVAEVFYFSLAPVSSKNSQHTLSIVFVRWFPEVFHNLKLLSLLQPVCVCVCDPTVVVHGRY